MKIINLVEDTMGKTGCLCEHGLSFYIETKKHKLLMDTGATDLFLKNAEKVGVDLTQIDTVILSHGHYDHTGGVLSFTKINPHATIYMQKAAGGEYYSVREAGEAYIGMDKEILSLPQVHFAEDFLRIDEELSLFSNITGRRFWPQSNLRLKCKVGESFVQDVFAHEQCLVIEQGGKRILLSGCAHNGILNILDRYKEIYDGAPDVVISGFHMVRKKPYTSKEEEAIRSTARELTELPTLFYTGHCTGEAAYDLMKEIMGEGLVKLHSGMRVQ